VSSAFVAAPSSVFTVTSSNFGREGAVVGAGITQEISRSAKLFLDYDGTLVGGFDQHAFSAGCRPKFWGEGGRARIHRHRYPRTVIR